MKEHLDTPGDENQKPSRWKILEKYNREERKNIDNIKNDAKLNGMEILDDREKMPPASTLRKIARVALRTLKLPGRKASERREWAELNWQAYDELSRERQGEEKEKQQRILEKNHSEAEKELEEYVIQKEKERREPIYEKIREKQELLDGMEKVRKEKKERFQQERIQEQAERNINATLTRVEDIKNLSEIPNSGVTAHTKEWQGKKVVIYDVKDIHFACTTHNITYKYNQHTGRETSRNLVANPLEWAEHLSTAKKHASFGNTDSSSMKGNVISMSFVDTDGKTSYANGDYITDDHKHHPAIVYGFDHLDQKSLLKISSLDGMTSNYSPDPEHGYLRDGDMDSVKVLSSDKSNYSELLVRRYDTSTGEPKLPDFILAENGNISDDMLRHAAFFGIPIINVDFKSYESKQAA